MFIFPTLWRLGGPQVEGRWQRRRAWHPSRCEDNSFSAAAAGSGNDHSCHGDWEQQNGIVHPEQHMLKAAWCQTVSLHPAMPAKTGTGFSSGQASHVDPELNPEHWADNLTEGVAVTLCLLSQEGFFWQQTRQGHIKTFIVMKILLERTRNWACVQKSLKRR